MIPLLSATGLDSAYVGYSALYLPDHASVHIGTLILLPLGKGEFMCNRAQNDGTPCVGMPSWHAGVWVEGKFWGGGEFLRFR